MLTTCASLSEHGFTQRTPDPETAGPKQFPALYNLDKQLFRIVFRSTGSVNSRNLFTDLFVPLVGQKERRNQRGNHPSVFAVHVHIYDHV